MVEFILTCAIGGIVGTIVGVIPGLGASTVAALLIPILIIVPPDLAIIFSMSLLYGAQYGGSITATLINIPGSPIAAIGMSDGHSLTKQGRVRDALFTCAYSSLIGGIVSTVFIYVSGIFIQQYSVDSDIIFNIILVAFFLMIFTDTPRQNMFVLALGGVVGMIGKSGGLLTFGVDEAYMGVSIILLSVCIFGVVESLHRLLIYKSSRAEEFCLLEATKKPYDRHLWFTTFFPSLRSSIIGLFSVIPGISWTMTCLFAYKTQKMLSKTPKEFGHGSTEGLAAAESCNNADAQVSFIPLLLFGIPLTFLSILISHLLESIPTEQISARSDEGSVLFMYPSIYTEILLSFLVTNIILFVLNNHLGLLWVKILNIEPRLLYASVFAICILTLSINITYVYELVVVGILIVIGMLLKANRVNVILMFAGYTIIPLMMQFFESYYTRRYDDVYIVLSDLKYSLVIISALLCYRYYEYSRHFYKIKGVEK
jgi:TctA family transporter